MRADLHVHTRFSDGLQTVEEVVREAYKNGVRLLAVTDHDTSYACQSFSDECKKYGITPVAGAEISAYIGDIKIHTLCYNADLNNPTYKNFLQTLKENSVKRGEEILSKLNKNGIKLSMEEVLSERACNDVPLHAMHIARAGAKRGYANSPNAFFMNYLGWGTVGFSTLLRPSPEEVLGVAQSAGGFCSLAHPGRIDMNKSDLYSLISKLKDRGLGGIEAVYSTHTANETAYYKEIAATFGLIVTGGSDTHVIGGRKKIGSPFFEADGKLLQKLGL